MLLIILTAALSGCLGWWLASKNRKAAGAERQIPETADMLSGIERHLSGLESFIQQETPAHLARIEASKIQRDAAIAN
ncbi:MAG: hypothetical protein PHY16_13610 [Methylobacter sp.]|nr:hypothetical protein [Methylobacter sp.]